MHVLAPQMRPGRLALSMPPGQVVAAGKESGDTARVAAELAEEQAALKYLVGAAVHRVTHAKGFLVPPTVSPGGAAAMRPTTPGAAAAEPRAPELRFNQDQLRTAAEDMVVHLMTRTSVMDGAASPRPAAGASSSVASTSGSVAGGAAPGTGPTAQEMAISGFNETRAAVAIEKVRNAQVSGQPRPPARSARRPAVVAVLPACAPASPALCANCALLPRCRCT